MLFDDAINNLDLFKRVITSEELWIHAYNFEIKTVSLKLYICTKIVLLLFEKRLELYSFTSSCYEM